MELARLGEGAVVPTFFQAQRLVMVIVTTINAFPTVLVLISVLLARYLPVFANTVDVLRVNAGIWVTTLG